MSGLRLGLVGAFNFPAPQGSQVYARGQALALAKAGAEVTLLCYGRGEGAPPGGLRVLRVARAISPRSLRAGPELAKPLADAALLRLVISATRRLRLDALLAHNAEAAYVALAARRATGVPVVYAVHTLLEEELPSYAPRALAGALRRAGRALDERLARGADAVLALTEAAADRLGGARTLAVIPPGLDALPPPAASEIARACARHTLTPGGFALYAGNLDAYQGLDRLDGAAARLPDLPVVAATHAAENAHFRHLRVVRVEDAEETRALLHGAALAVAPRTCHGGFPIKLLNYMEAGRAIVAPRDLVDTLRHGESAWLVPPDATPADVASAIGTLRRDPARAAALGAAARAALELEHAWPDLAERTLALVRRARAASPITSAAGAPAPAGPSSRPAPRASSGDPPR
jgi:glycosyltransferase involved in cell wall biosynthesis